MNFSRFANLFIALPLFLSGCVTPAQIRKAVAENPDIVLQTIDQNPELFMKSFYKANESARKLAAEKEIACHAHQRHQRQGLIDSGDAAIERLLGRAEAHRLALDEDLT